MKVSMTVNGTAYEHDVEPRTLLVQHLRENMGLTEHMLDVIPAVAEPAQSS